MKDSLRLDNYQIRSFTVDSASEPPFDKIEYQTLIIEKLYPNGFVAVKELSTQYTLAASAFCLCTNAIYEYRPAVLKGIMTPEMWNNSEHLVLTHNTAEQLDIMKKGSKKKTDSLFTFLDNTQTPGGRRLLQTWLLNPSTNLQEIQKRLDLVEIFIGFSDEIKAKLKSYLQNITVDIRRLLRRAEMNDPHHYLGVSNLYILYTSYKQIHETIYWLCETIEQMIDNGDHEKAIKLEKWLIPPEQFHQIEDFTQYIEDTFNLDILQKINQIPNDAKDFEFITVFKPGVVEEIDTIINKTTTGTGKEIGF